MPLKQTTQIVMQLLAKIENPAFAKASAGRPERNVLYVHEPWSA